MCGHKSDRIGSIEEQPIAYFAWSVAEPSSELDVMTAMNHFSGCIIQRPPVSWIARQNCRVKHAHPHIHEGIGLIKAIVGIELEKIGRPGVVKVARRL